MSFPDAGLAVAVDIGGTFTDVALQDRATGRVWRAKTPSVPSDPSEAFMRGVGLALEQAGQGAKALDRVYDAGARLAGLRKEDAERLAGNSDAQSDGSTTD